MSLAAALLLLASTPADPLAASTARLEQVLPGVSRHVTTREEAKAWLAADPWGGQLVVPEAVLASATSDAERDALVLVTIAWAKPPAAKPLFSPLGQFLADMVAVTVQDAILTRNNMTPNDIPAVHRPLGIAREPVRLGPPPARRAITLATRLGIGVCPMAAALDRLAAPGPDGRYSQIAFDARRARRELGIAAHGC